MLKRRSSCWMLDEYRLGRVHLQCLSTEWIAYAEITILASTTESDTIELKIDIYLSVADIDNDMHMYPVILGDFYNVNEKISTVST